MNSLPKAEISEKAVEQPDPSVTALGKRESYVGVLQTPTKEPFFGKEATEKTEPTPHEQPESGTTPGKQH